MSFNTQQKPLRFKYFVRRDNPHDNNSAIIAIFVKKIIYGRNLETAT